MTTRFGRSMAALLLAGTLATGCADATPDQAPTDDRPQIRTASAVGAQATDEAVRHVVAISVDGLNPRALTRLGRELTPAMHRMRRQGTGTLNARTLRERTVTLPNHASMITGRRARGDRGHGVLMNVDPGGTVHDLAGHRVRSMFGVVDRHGGSTALFTTKAKFDLFRRSWRRQVHAFDVDREAALVRRLREQLTRDPAELTFLHLGLLDQTGHAHGFMSAEYLDATRRVDRWVGSILDTVASDPALARQTVVLLTADHGGRGGGHSDVTRLANYRVPFLAWGATVAEGTNLYRLNPHREPPGRERTRYRGAQPIRNGDLGNLVTDLLGLPRILGSEFNADQRLSVSH